MGAWKAHYWSRASAKRPLSGYTKDSAGESITEEVVAEVGEKELGLGDWPWRHEETPTSPPAPIYPYITIDTFWWLEENQIRGASVGG